MGMTEFVTSILSWEDMLPAVSQGAIGIQCRADDTKSLKYLAKLNHPETKICVDCERSFLASLDGNCRTPIAGQAWIEDGLLKFRGLLMKEDGSEVFETKSEGLLTDALKIGAEAGAKLKMAAPHLVDAFKLTAEEARLSAPLI